MSEWWFTVEILQFNVGSWNQSSTDITVQLSMIEGCHHRKRIPFLSAQSIFYLLSPSYYNHTYYNLVRTGCLKQNGKLWADTRTQPIRQQHMVGFPPQSFLFLPSIDFIITNTQTGKKSIANANGGLLISRQLSCHCIPSGRDLYIISLTVRKLWFGGGV